MGRHVKIICWLVALAFTLGGRADWPAEFLFPPESSFPEIAYLVTGSNLCSRTFSEEVESIASAGFSALLFRRLPPSRTDPAREAGRIREAVERANRAGLDVVLDDRSRLYTLSPENRGRELTCSLVTLEGGETLKGTLPLSRTASRPEAAYRDLAVLAFPVSDSPVRLGKRGGRPSSIRIDPWKLWDLTGRVEDGHLDWRAPKGGDWIILRIGHIVPLVSDSSRSCDRFTSRAAEEHFERFTGTLFPPPALFSSPHIGNGVLLSLPPIAPLEWTEDAAECFRGRYGYTIQDWLPVLFGYTVKSPEASRRFLKDWAALQRSLFRDRFLARYLELARERGVRLFHQVRPEGNRCGESIPASLPADRTLEWLPDGGLFDSAALRAASPVRMVLGWSDPSPWRLRLRDLKSRAHLLFAEGATRLILETYTHQALPDVLPPGLHASGFPLNSRQPWWPEIGRLTRYLARCTVVLESGLPVSDILCCTGDGFASGGRSSVSGGYRTDYCRDEDLLSLNPEVEGGQWCLKDGRRYPLLWIPDFGRMDPALLERVLEGIEAGGVAVSDRLPSSPLSLSESEEVQERFEVMCRRYPLVHAPFFQTPVYALGEGYLFIDRNIGPALKFLNLPPQISSSDILWQHRCSGNRSWYLIAPKGETGFRGTLCFRSRGRVSLWNPETGEERSPVLCVDEMGGTRISVDLAPSEGCLVLFEEEGGTGSRFTALSIDGKKVGLERKGGPAVALSAPLLQIRKGTPVAWTNGLFTLQTSRGESLTHRVEKVRRMAFNVTWHLQFPEGWGIAPSLWMRTLRPWPEMNGTTLEGRAFSGRAEYLLNFSIPEVDASTRFMLDLGEVNSIAAVTVNQKRFAPLWAPPYRLDISSAVKPGVNHLSVLVSDTWQNRLIYDASRKEGQRRSRAIPAVDPKGVPERSGLLGPVSLTLGEAFQGK